MDRYVAQQNVDRYRRLLADADDECDRRTLSVLLAEEEAKLAQILAKAGGHAAEPPTPE